MKVYRVHSGYQHKHYNRLQEIIDYEADVLGNLDIRYQAQASDVSMETPARDCEWVCFTFDDARRYVVESVNEIECWNVESVWVIAADGDGGFLVTYPELAIA